MLGYLTHSLNCQISSNAVWLNEQSLEDAKRIMGDVGNISKLFIEFQQHLNNQRVA